MKAYLHKMGNVISLGGFGTLHLILFFLNTFAGIIGAIWLLFRGEWKVVVGGFIASLMMPNLWWILLLPGLGIVHLMFKCDQNKFGFRIIAFTNVLYQSLVLSAWVVLVFLFFNTGLLGYQESKNLLIPMALVGYSVAVSPIIYLASHETPDNLSAHSMVFLSEVGYILLVGLSLCRVALSYSLGVLALLAVANATFVMYVFSKISKAAEE